MTMKNIFLIFGEKRTVHLLIVPVITMLTTLQMTQSNYEWDYILNRSKGAKERGYQLSQIVNYDGKEPWGQWLGRYVLWHLTIFLIMEFKLEILPRELRWMPVAWGVALALVIYSGFHQLYGPYKPEPEYGLADPRDYHLPPPSMQILHIVAALFAFFMCWFESVMIWCNSKYLHIFYACDVFFFIFTQLDPQGKTDVHLDYHEFIPQWTVIFLHVAVVWYNAPRVQREIQEGTFKGWYMCCHCCCPTLPARRGPNVLCPPDKDVEMHAGRGSVELTDSRPAAHPFREGD